MSGIIIIPIFIFYVLVSGLILTLILKALNIKINKIILIIIVVLLPFWDLFVQKGIKTYYQLFLLDPIVYEYPEFDKNGKIESMIERINFMPDDSQFNNKLYNYYSNYISDYIIYYAVNNYSKEINKIVKLDLVNKTYNYNEKLIARYDIVKSKPENSFFGFYMKQKNKFIDRKMNKVLATTTNIIFKSKYSYFREHILLLITGASQTPLFYVKNIFTNKKYLKQALKLKGF